MQFQYHMWQFFCHIGWFPYLFLTLDGSIFILCSSNITCDNCFLTFGVSLTFFFSHLAIPSSHCAVPTLHVIIFFSYLVVPLLFFLTFNDSIFKLCDSNITYDCSFVTLGGFLTFFSHLTIPSSHCIVPISHVTVFFHI